MASDQTSKKGSERGRSFFGTDWRRKNASRKPVPPCRSKGMQENKPIETRPNGTSTRRWVRQWAGQGSWPGKIPRRPVLGAELVGIHAHEAQPCSRRGKRQSKTKATNPLFTPSPRLRGGTISMRRLSPAGSGAVTPANVPAAGCGADWILMSSWVSQHYPKQATTAR